MIKKAALIAVTMLATSTCSANGGGPVNIPGVEETLKNIAAKSAIVERRSTDASAVAALASELALEADNALLIQAFADREKRELPCSFGDLSVLVNRLSVLVKQRAECLEGTCNSVYMDSLAKEEKVTTQEIDNIIESCVINAE